MPRNPERPLAPHVQAAIAAGQGMGQAKLVGQQGEREMAAHVQAAIGVGQAKLGGQQGEREMAAHVQAAIGAGQGVGQAKLGGPGGGRQVAAHVSAVVGAGQAVGRDKMAEPKGGGRPVAAEVGGAVTRAIQRKAVVGVEREVAGVPRRPNPGPTWEKQLGPRRPYAIRGNHWVAEPLLTGAGFRRGAPVQRKIGIGRGRYIYQLQDLLNRIEEPFRGAITDNRALMMKIIDMLDASYTLSRNDVFRVIISYKFKENFREGAFNGTLEVGPARPWADLHVTGATGGRLDKSTLIRILKRIYRVFQLVWRFTGVEGELEWHPTGAVVTKQVVSLLGQCFGKGWAKAKANILYFKRKKVGKAKVRNKLASKIDIDLLSEYFSFLESLQGVNGIRIVPIGISPPPGLRRMRREDQVREFDRSMIDATPKGKRRLATYKKEYTEAKPDKVPSLKVIVKARLIPKMIEAISA